MDVPVEELEAAVGAGNVLTDPDLTQSYVGDWTGRFVGRSPAVVRPGSTAEVAAVLAICSRHRVAVVPQGGNTGLVGGGVPLGGEVVLSLRRLAHLGVVDRLAGQVTVGAGATLAAVQDHVATNGYAVGVDLAARDSATVGGMVATNAGGIHVVRHGAMRAQVAGVEAVLADGTVLSHLGGLVKDNTGYDLDGLLCGSEGTLAVVTAVRLRLVPRSDFRVAALMGLGSVSEAVAAVEVLRRSVPSLEAVEAMFDDGIALVRHHLGLPDPLPAPSPVYLLVEAAGPTDPVDELAAAAEVIRPAAVAVADTVARRAELWRYREAHTEVINALGPPVKLDVTLPAGALAEFVPTVRARVATVVPAAATFLFGHLADGNLHVNVVGVEPDARPRVEEAVLELVAGSAGSISAEHGIGSVKRRFLHLNRSPSEIAAFRSIKAALDPNGILNPGVLLPPEEG